MGRGLLLRPSRLYRLTGQLASSAVRVAAEGWSPGSVESMPRCICDTAPPTYV